MDIVVKIEEYTFNVRVAGIITNQDKILLHKSKEDDFYALPGGRIKIGEDSKQSLKREFQEEIGTEIAIEKFLGVVENFFEYNNKKYHELMLLYQVSLKDLDMYERDKIIGLEANGKIEFIWKSRNTLKEIDVRPKFLKEKLIKKESIGHVVNDMLNLHE